MQKRTHLQTSSIHSQGFGGCRRNIVSATYSGVNITINELHLVVNDVVFISQPIAW